MRRLNVQTCSRLIDGHRDWLSSFDDHYLRKWDDRFAADPQAAICEAEVRQLLSDHTVRVHLNEDPACGGPDFLCTKNDTHFYVEVAAASMAAVRDSTGLDTVLSDRGCPFDLLTRKIRAAVRGKTAQLQECEWPAILAISTLHQEASQRHVINWSIEDSLTGSPSIVSNGDATDLRDAVFLRGTPEGIEYMARPISAILVCGFGTQPAVVAGMLHPAPVRPFERELLSNIPFCRLRDEYLAGILRVDWV